ncbi:MAG TPA: PEPxxWA-CTERM sorting domain-containing protein [Sphingomonas sp.]|jgi:hypothetical protein|nr:PEPxxWA-CTERM sorting domain-containing protein [Sphingomonas sp.]
MKSVKLAVLAALFGAAAPASAALTGDAVVVKRVQGHTVFKTVMANVGSGIEYSDNFFAIDIGENDILFDAFSNFSIGDIRYTIEGLDFDDRPATPNLIAGFTSQFVFGIPSDPFGQQRAVIQDDGIFRLSFANTTGAGSGFVRITLGAPAAVPEPASWALMIGGFGLAGAAARRRISGRRGARAALA